MKRISLMLFFMAGYLSLFGQNAPAQDSLIKKYKLFEHRGYAEILFSFSQTEQDGKGVNDKLRFSPVFNFGHEFHLNFSEFLGIYTGLGIRNVGYVDRPEYFAPGAVVSTQLRMKHRVYALVLPLGIKIGNIGKHSYFSAGAELNLFFNYKEKAWLNDSKTKKSEWFSDRTELVNTSFFAQLTLRDSYVKLILYPDNFIKEHNTTFAGDFVMPNYPSSSANIFVISVGGYMRDLKYKKKGKVTVLRYT
jgi:hypothetical protein